eukprot:CAMPEP_0198556050 /NCGR_PEP_ID=MMETSP1462-20131121/86008_1 /TAXON_ID=1333877 /ORGANISM="Brandtodinium nutriculum, Strain RCC3387" /LENGTH=275 /DNA_ID=CAMNT_0044286785 /DNA_START=1 /DNA_END=824 /DNA_ORIENTATION=-
MAETPDECTRHVVAASAAENAGIELDRAGKVREAIAKYEECERELAAAIAAARPAHAEDHPKLVQHREEVLSRIAHLRTLNGRPPTIPVEDQIKAVQLGMQATSAAQAAVGSAGGVKTMAACAAMGVGAGLIVLGGTLGVTISAIGGAAGAAYVATRQDKAGEMARKAGEVAIHGAERAVELNEKHRVTEKIADAGSKVVAKARETDEKYDITGKIAHGAEKLAAKAKEVEQRHSITDRVAAGISAGFGKLSSAMEKKPASSTAAGSAGPAPGAG